MINTQNIGIKDAVAIICGEMEKTTVFSKLGFRIDYKTLKMTALQPCSTAFAENNWTHIVFVVDKTINTVEDIGLDNVENLNPTKTLNIYINGTRSALQELSDSDLVNDSTHGIYLNCANTNNEISNFGETSIKLLRCYNKPLNAEEVLKNYYNALYNVAKVKKEKDKNSLLSTPIPVLYMIRNKWISKTIDSQGNEHVSEAYADATPEGMNEET